MKKRNTPFLLIICLLVAQSCKDDATEGVMGDLQLVEVTATLDDDDLTTIPVSGFVPSISESTFTYNTEDGAASGTWKINEDQTVLILEYEMQSFEYPLVSYSKTEFTFVVHTIDLNDALSEKDQNSILLINQKLVQSGSSWNKVAKTAQLLEITFTLRYE